MGFNSGFKGLMNTWLGIQLFKFMIIPLCSFGVKLDAFECWLFKVYKTLCTNKNMKLYLMKTFFDLTSDLFLWHILAPIVRKRLCLSALTMVNTVLTLKQDKNLKVETTENVADKDESWTKRVALQCNVLWDFVCSENRQIELRADTGKSGSSSAPLKVCASEGLSSASLNSRANSDDPSTPVNANDGNSLAHCDVNAGKQTCASTVNVSVPDGCSYDIQKLIEALNSDSKKQKTNKQFTDDKQKSPGVKCYTCDECNNLFCSNYELRMHMRIHMEEKPHKCGLCDQAFFTRSHLNRHQRTHTGVKPYRCEICNKRFSERGNVVVHVRTHTGEKHFTCEFCPKQFSNSSDLKKHIRTHTGEKPYNCELCSQAFSNRSHLARHRRTHTGEKPFECEYCKKSFAMKACLVMHLRCHTGEPPEKCYRCDFCDKVFVYPSHVTAHLRTHTGEKPFSCHICGQAFSNSSQVTAHVRTHTGEKPYECEICQRAFSRRGSLSKHRRTHTGEKPHVCVFCGKAFSQSWGLTVHLRTHPGSVM